LYRPEWVAPHDEDWYRRMLGGQLAGPEAGLIEQALYYETAVNLTGDMLVKVDRMSMANSLEVRSPLLDHRLGEMAASLPTAWKMGAGGQGKKILIDAMADRLPPELLNREKQGFGIPLAAWFRNELRPMLEELLLGKRFLERGFVHPEMLRATIEEHRTGRRDNSMWLWSLLMLELWMQWIEQPLAVER
jgi:asparagine synthase (glutamine-hydrolysing)